VGTMVAVIGKSWSISVGIESLLALCTDGESRERASVFIRALGGSGGSLLPSEVLAMVDWSERRNVGSTRKTV